MYINSLSPQNNANLGTIIIPNLRVKERIGEVSAVAASQVVQLVRARAGTRAQAVNSTVFSEPLC